MKDIPIFLHIPKTGGTTVRDIINRQYKIKNIFTIATLKDSDTIHNEKLISDLNTYKIIQGHLKYGFHNKVNINPAYFTVLRDPVERVLSTYYYVLNTTNNPQNISSKDKQMSIYEFIESGINPFLINGQTQLIAGRPCNISDPLIHSEELYLTAKDNLENTFIFTGITDMFDESIILLKRILKWKIPYYSTANRTKKKPNYKKISSDIRAFIEENNQLDLKIFEFARNSLINRINEGGEELRYEISRFKKTNKMINPLFGYSRAKRWFVKHF